MIFDYLILFFCGLSFAFGAVNVAIGSAKIRDGSYLYFGILSLVVSLFLLVQISSVADKLPGTLPDQTSLILAVTIFALFVWFIGAYTQYQHRALQWLITSMTISVLVLSYLARYFSMPSYVMGFWAHFVVFSVFTYGVLAGLKGESIHTESTGWKVTYLGLMTLFVAMTIITGWGYIFGTFLIYDPPGYMTLIDFFPIVFLLVVGSKMSHDIIRSYQLERVVRMKERRWNDLLGNINLLVVEVNQRNQIVYVNPYFRHITGLEEEQLLGNGFASILPNEDDSLECKVQRFLKSEESEDLQSKLPNANGGTSSVQWTKIQSQGAKMGVDGAFVVGMDVSRREEAYQKIKQLKEQLEKENLLLRDEIRQKDAPTFIIGQSDELKYAIKRARQVASTDATILLEGETGVGKELFADLIQRESLRKHKPFIKVNCAAIPKDLVESELFGHEKGAFTGAMKLRLGRFERADKGTIFLDEIGELPIELQPKLLRVLQTGEFERVGGEQTKKVDVRVIAATNRDLHKEQMEGRFREDLYFRLNVYPITIPPLRQRKEDIEDLVRFFVRKLGKRIGKRASHITKADLSMLASYDWPGNVRELENVIERAIINSTNDTLIVDELDVTPERKLDLLAHASQNTFNLNESQREHIIKVLQACNWKINGEDGAATNLGMPPSTLRSKMKKLDIQRPSAMS